MNTILGEERVIAFDEPGTTRDAITIDFERGGQKYTLIDTAGIRRRGKVFEAIEKFSVIKTLQAIEDTHVVVLLLEATHTITEQDARWWLRSTNGMPPTARRASRPSATSTAR